MRNLEHKFGPLTVRTWGLVVNLLANATALFGLSLVLTGQGGWPILIAGTLMTVICIAVIARPADMEE